MTGFSPQKAIETLREGAVAIELIGHRLLEKKKEYVVAEAKLLDAEWLAQEVYFAEKPCKISELPAWLKRETYQERKEERRIWQEMKCLETELEISLQVLNAVKAGFKIAEMEIQNLNLRP